MVLAYINDENYEEQFQDAKCESRNRITVTVTSRITV